MTEPKAQHPMFEGRRIELGDEVSLTKKVSRIASDGTLEVHTLVGVAWFDAGDLSGHTPAPRPLVPGPALLDRVGSIEVEVLAVDGAEAWVRFSNGSRHTLDTSRLRNTEGAAS